MHLRERAGGHLWVQAVPTLGAHLVEKALWGEGKSAPASVSQQYSPLSSRPHGPDSEGLSDGGGGCGRGIREMGRDIWAVGADLLPFSRADLGIKWHEIEHRPGSPQRQGSPRPGAEMQREQEWEGWPRATLGCFWVQMEGEWKGAGPAPPPQPLPALLSPQTSRGACQTPVLSG